IFLVTLYTGSRWNAGTEVEVFLQLIGQHGRSKFRCLWHKPSPAFQRGSIDCFLITTARNLGDIHSFKVRLKNEGESPTWGHLDSVFVECWYRCLFEIHCVLGKPFYLRKGYGFACLCYSSVPTVFRKHTGFHIFN
uniref:PLAT domain-containing protein n=1 Tax=Cyanistes caeruleus TaxID=156563 RepID=A0A8C0U867_CYACU